MQKILARIPFYILLIGIYPVIALYSTNINEVLFSSTLRASIFSIVLVGLLYLFVYLLRKRSDKVPAISAVFLLFFYLYGHIFNLIDNVTINGFLIGRHRYFFPLWVTLFIIAAYAISKSKRISTLNYILNVSAAILVTLTTLSISAHLMHSTGSSESVAENNPTQTLASERTLPNVYYIIMDSYGREDVLFDIYHLDNHEFILELEQLGFMIPLCTQSNYSTTVLSLSSSLNMNYLDALEVPLVGEIRTRDFEPYIKQSAVRRFFEQMGYETVTMKTVYPYLDITDSTYYYDYFQDESRLGSIESLNFQHLFMMTTALRPVIEYFEFHSGVNMPGFVARLVPNLNILNNRNYKQYQQNLYLLDALENDIPKIPGNKFVYAHLFVTHQPFGFTPDGKFRWPVLESDDAYRDQIIYANKRIISILKSILTNEQIPPVIVIQGDHSYSHTNRRVQILNAYYLPDGGNQVIYPEITPVNTFRVILNEYFDGNYKLLEDVSYYSTEEEPFIFEEVPATCVNP